ncbi:hypothetical protein WH96_18715 [Kiloniella spongiae]|uniref:Lipoprotein n=1 Tax=Kiloniella spongiae TaxID=1489064 RepID=A0A0H2MEN2_9PROT|nr:hypothetical protein [Kiloniella spongiae]KLN59182.1 hypothetical protein WH96_18715 [Kiloniella spongiae]
MKSLFTACVLACTLLVSACGTTSMPNPEINLKGPLALDEKGMVELSGSGFVPNSDVTLVFRTIDGVESDITYAVDPTPKADGEGNWVTMWSYGRFVKKKLVAAGDYTLIAADPDFTPLVQEVVSFQ